MTRGGKGVPLTVDQLCDVAEAYLSGDSRQQIVDAFREAGVDEFAPSTLHARLQVIRQRTGIRSNVEACQELMAHPERYTIEPRAQITPEAIAWRAAMRKGGYTMREIGRNVGVSESAIREHFRRHPL